MRNLQHHAEFHQIMLAVRNPYATILCYTIFIIIYSAAMSLPVQPNIERDTSGKNDRNETNESPPLNSSTGDGPKSKSLRSARSFGGPDTETLEHRIKERGYLKRGEKKRSGVDIGIHIKQSTPNYGKDLDKLEKMLEKALEGGELGEALNASLCPKCDEEEGEPYLPDLRRIKPAFNCDEWDIKFRLCILERNVGDTVTFYLSTGTKHGTRHPVIWMKEFHRQHSKIRTPFHIDPDNSPENIIIGKLGYELRISPITEIDVGYNLFSAEIEGSTSAHSKLYFMIRIVPIDLGFVYVGETIELNLRSYVSLPAVSLSFMWYMEQYGEHSTLPSNMRTSSAASSIKISELRQEQEGILACSVYTNLAFLATKKRFLLKDLAKNNDVLKSAPDHDLEFAEAQAEIDDKRKRKKLFMRHTRDVDIGDMVEKALMAPPILARRSATEPSHGGSTTRSYDDYNVEMDVGNGVQAEGDLDGDRQPLQEIDILAENNPADEEGAGPDDNISVNHNGQGLEESAALQAENGEGYAGDGSQLESSEVILNIDKIPGQRKISAEEKMAHLISTCFSDFECSGFATCIKTNLKHAGICKCLPGFYGVGIFCREDIWLSKNNFDMEDFQNPEDIPYNNDISLIRGSN